MIHSSATVQIDGFCDLPKDALVSDVILSLGSNADSVRAFYIAKQALDQLGELMMSDRIIGKDFTGKTDKIYHNACASLRCHNPASIVQLSQNFKQIERLCGRSADNTIKQYVPMDLDILAVRINKCWYIHTKRLPLKAHERAGLSQVAQWLLSY
ncbi:2-amino-4-hydroxy-6-hydroxymethyldihydropteridine diphosphokinase [Moraxella nasovis]|uniref:2-amino-4-hydroxy-6- hydroxymethyldihydropteridine diphosphokinase n=1 Tax=Moraxella nasovis TaxID=2904121 RepID=UPI001F61D432|nr:2-amino-4-hydroxy-6-hydroxymethyldihydropteridine diphosphokinase [Moraxella nasovis]UNU73148.1 2-amino-4-hydroxy-6-hydroxymethyldihydropteridine diphosphokinase [Moraxella nasovis]